MIEHILSLADASFDACTVQIESTFEDIISYIEVAKSKKTESLTDNGELQAVIATTMHRIKGNILKECLYELESQDKLDENVAVQRDLLFKYSEELGLSQGLQSLYKKTEEFKDDKPLFEKIIESYNKKLAGRSELSLLLDAITNDHTPRLQTLLTNIGYDESEAGFEGDAEVESANRKLSKFLGDPYYMFSDEPSEITPAAICFILHKHGLLDLNTLGSDIKKIMD